MSFPPPAAGAFCAALLLCCLAGPAAAQSAVSGVSSDGLTTTALPARRAGMASVIAIVSG